MLTVEDFDFVLPPELIAQQPAPQRSGSRLLDAGSPPALHDRVFRDLPQLLRAGDLLVFNDTRVIPARLWGHKAGPVLGRPGGGKGDPHARLGSLPLQGAASPAPTPLRAVQLGAGQAGAAALSPEGAHRVLGRPGGAVEVLVERILEGNRVWAHVRASKSPKPGQALWLGDERPGTDAQAGAVSAPGAGFAAWVIGRAGPDGGLFELEFSGEPLDLLQRFGAVPLPPYIRHAPDAQDVARYQTVYACEPGSVAAPTAGLHFDDALLAQLDAKGVRRASVTLHVGAGTFQPVRVTDLRQHRMHSEWYAVPESTGQAIADVRARQARALAAGQGDTAPRVVAVGTTAMRALESAALAAEAAGQPAGSVLAGARETALFVTPGYHFRVVDALVTNFHLPRSTLLMLVAAFSGMDTIHSAYAHAIARKYRFFSYGDAMWLTRAKTQPDEAE